MSDNKKKKPSRFDPKSRWVKYDKESQLWIPSRKRIFLYWFKFLQHAERDSSRKVNWKKYEGWGGANYILGTKFDDFWEQNWKELFGVKNEGDEPKFSLSTKQPKADGIRYALLVYENLHRGDNWKIAEWIAKREEQKRGAGVGGSFFYAREDVDSDFEMKQIMQSRVGRYKTASKKYLDNVCKGIFP